MSYNRDNYKRIREQFAVKHVDALKDAELREEELHRIFPELIAIDNALAETGPKILQAASGASGKELDDRIAAIMKENTEIRTARELFLKNAGYPADYSSPHYDCEKCQDTGYVGLTMCSCMRRALSEAGYESSGIGGLIRKQNFDTFDISYQKSDKRAYENTKFLLSMCRNYADNYPKVTYKNLLMIGPTGLGKTHLSTSIAKTLIDREYDVVYDSAQNIFSAFEFERFGRSYSGGGEPSKTDRFFDCDLLIFDDLGTEVTNQFTVSCLYNIINTRLNHEKATIINTNLSRDELRKRYTDRITSRLFGEFQPLPFFGSDVREKKLEQ